MTADLTDKLRYTDKGRMQALTVFGGWVDVPIAAQLAIERLAAFEFSRRELLNSPAWQGRDRITVLELVAGALK